MKTKKPKRIRAMKAHLDMTWGVTTEIALKGHTVPAYILRQSDIRALAEQLADDYWKSCGLKNDNHMLYALRRAGMTPGKGAK